jgi:hypothetical protein
VFTAGVGRATAGLKGDHQLVAAAQDACVAQVGVEGRDALLGSVSCLGLCGCSCMRICSLMCHESLCAMRVHSHEPMRLL